MSYRFFLKSNPSSYPTLKPASLFPLPTAFSLKAPQPGSAEPIRLNAKEVLDLATVEDQVIFAG